MFASPRVRSGFAAVIREAFRTGARGAQHDYALMVSDWGFDLAQVKVPLTAS